ncbi:MAG TPA: hypothetical protein VGC41_25645, partial [Kofleriaceae bacterium]
LMTVPGLINVDFADVRTIMSNMGRALMGTGIGEGKRRATEAAEMAISSPLLEDVSIEGATGILINITGGPDLTLHEVNEASTLIQNAAHEDANIIFGSVIDPNLTDEVRITVIATGFDRAAKTQMIVDSGRANAAIVRPSQVTMPYDVSTQTTKEYPTPRMPAKQPAILADDPDISIEMEAAVEALEADAHMAMGSGPATPVDGTPVIYPGEPRKRAQSRPSMKAVLTGEIDTESELDVPTFIRRHSATNIS